MVSASFISKLNVRFVFLRLEMNCFAGILTALLESSYKWHVCILNTFNQSLGLELGGQTDLTDLWPLAGNLCAVWPRHWSGLYNPADQTHTHTLKRPDSILRVWRFHYFCVLISRFHHILISDICSFILWTTTAVSPV